MKRKKEVDFIISCPHCGQMEYNDHIHWFDGHRYCRRCIYDIWERTTKWRRRENDLTFPMYEKKKIGGIAC